MSPISLPRISPVLDGPCHLSMTARVLQDFELDCLSWDSRMAMVFNSAGFEAVVAVDHEIAPGFVSPYYASVRYDREGEPYLFSRSCHSAGEAWEFLGVMFGETIPYEFQAYSPIGWRHSS